MFNIFLNDLFLWLKKSDLYNFADDNIITATSKKLEDLLSTLEQESESAIGWFRLNNMVVNPNKFQAIILSKNSSKDVSCNIRIKNNIIKSTDSVKILGVTIDRDLKFKDHISDLCSKAAGQLNAFSRLQKYMGRKEKEVIINSFIYANFNYCPFVWHFCSGESIHKIEKIKKRCLRILLNDNESDYETLLKKANKPSMEVKRLRILAIEIFKTLNDMNPSFMKNIFTLKTNAKIRPTDLLVKRHNSATYGDKSLSVLGPKIWNSLTPNIKSETSFNKFKEYIGTWVGPKVPL